MLKVGNTYEATNGTRFAVLSKLYKTDTYVARSLASGHLFEFYPTGKSKDGNIHLIVTEHIVRYVLFVKGLSGWTVFASFSDEKSANEMALNTHLNPAKVVKVEFDA